MQKQFMTVSLILRLILPGEIFQTEVLVSGSVEYEDENIKKGPGSADRGLA